MLLQPPACPEFSAGRLADNNSYCPWSVTTELRLQTSGTIFLTIIIMDLFILMNHVHISIIDKTLENICFQPSVEWSLDASFETIYSDI